MMTEEQALLQQLDGILQSQLIRGQISAIAERVRSELTRNQGQWRGSPFR
jgi:hypothetical protein